MREIEKQSLYNWADVHILYENQGRFSMPDSRNWRPGIKIKIFYFFGIFTLTMFGFDRAFYLFLQAFTAAPASIGLP
jgi:hypothetical protein